MTVSDPSPTTASRIRMTRVLGVELARGQLERPADRRDLLDAGQRPERLEQDRLAAADLPDHGDHRPLGTGVLVRIQALSEDVALDIEHLGLGWRRRSSRRTSRWDLLVGRPAKQKSRGLHLCFVRPARPVPLVQ
jgi:hypothetical protein